MKKILILTSITIITMALMLFIPNEVSAAPGANAQLDVIDANDNVFHFCNGGIITGVEIPGTSSTNPSASYDETSNTLTLNNFNGRSIIATDMGDDFEIKVIGNNTTTIIETDDAVKFIGDGSLTVDVDEWETSQLFMGTELGIFATNKVEINGPTIKMTLNNTGVPAQGIISEGAIKIDSGKIEIQGNFGMGINCYNFGQININGGNLTISALDCAISSQEKVEINGGNLKLKSENMGIYAGNRIILNGGITEIEAGNMAVLVENIYEDISLTLSDKMKIDEGVKVTKGTHDFYGHTSHFATFSKGTVTFDPQTYEFINATKNITIKDSNVTTGNGQGNQGSTSQDLTIQGAGQAIAQKPAEKDDTPKTGNESILYMNNKVVIITIVLTLITLAAVIKK